MENIVSYSILYTKQTHKKRPSWLDGTLNIDRVSGKATILNEEKKFVESFPLPKGQNIDKLEDFDLPNLGIQIDTKITKSDSIVSKPKVGIPEPKKISSTPSTTQGRNSKNSSLILVNELLNLLIEDPTPVLETTPNVAPVSILEDEENEWNLEEISKFENSLKSTKLKPISTKKNDFFECFDDIQDEPELVLTKQTKRFVSPLIKKSDVVPSRSEPKEVKKTYPTNMKYVATTIIPQKQAIAFPSAAQLKLSTEKPRRRVILPNEFNNLMDYKETFLNALFEQVNLEMHELSSKYHSLLSKQTKTRSKMMRSMGIQYYEKIEIYTNTFKKENNCFIKISDKEKSGYAKDDIWILSADDSFSEVFLVKSLYHGPTSTGIIQVKPLNNKFKSTNSGYAIRGANLSTELEMIDNLGKLDLQTFPILKDCFKKQPLEKQFWIDLDLESIDRIAQECIEKYNLNQDQQAVLYECQKWFNNDKTQSPVVLIHGVFGSGKSYLLVALILFFVEILTAAKEQNIRILISAVTNVAVDRILEGLVALDFHDLIRVGSQRKISKVILPYTVSTDKSQKELIKEYKEMLKEPLSEVEAKGVKQALQELQNGIFEERKASLKSVKVVGTTCVATTFPILNDSRFSIVILDESSQCIEPLALLPLRFGCEKMIACGDPLQLDPTLSGSSIDPKNTLEKTIFLRLSKIGYQPITLFTQYRCHPTISYLNNKMFYNNQLKDGIKPTDRPPIVPGLPPLMIVDTQGKETYSESSGSNYNEAEIKVIMKLVTLLLQQGVENNEIGIISLYQLQAWKISNELKNASINLKVSTVDAFQGGEKKIIILSCVKTESLGFIENEKRLNVALSRAKNHLFIVCNQKSLTKGSFFNIVFGHAKTLTNGIKYSDEILACNTWTEILEKESAQEAFNDMLAQIDFDVEIQENDKKRPAEDDLNQAHKK